MKRFFFVLILVFLFSNIQAQKSFRYGITAGLNLSTGILPDLELNTNINSILKGDKVVEGTPQLADMVALYKVGFFIRYDTKIGSAKFNINYTNTEIKKILDLSIFSVNALDLQMEYLDFDLTYNLNLFKNFYFSLGYVPSLLISVTSDENPQIETFDSRVLSGFGFRFNNGTTLAFNAVIGLKEVIEGSYIHNVMIPITLNVPLN